MKNMPTSTALRAEIAAILARVRRRWRLRRTLLGTICFLGVFASVAVLAALAVAAPTPRMKSLGCDEMGRRMMDAAARVAARFEGG